MVSCDLVKLTAFFVKADKAFFAECVVVRDVYAKHRGDAPKGVDHSADDCPVAKADYGGRIDAF